MTIASTDVIRVVTCAGGAAWEAPLVHGLSQRELGVEVVRRCVDHGELLGIALRERPRAALVAAELPWLDRELVGALHDAGVAVIAVESAVGVRPLSRFGVQHVLTSDVTADELRVVLHRLGATTHGAARQSASAPSGGGGGGGQLVVVWGTAGAPGRTTVAIHLAEELARTGRSVALVDGDGWAPSIAQRVAGPDSPSITKAARLAADGWPEPLSTCLHVTRSGVRVLAGLPRADLWTEVRERTWRAVLDDTRTHADVVVVDVAAPIEEDEELSFDRAPYRRNVMTRVALSEADTVLLVAAGDPVGVRRLVFAHRQLVDNIPSARDVRVVMNRVPDSAARHRELAVELERWSGLRPSALLPAEPMFERSVWEGRALHDVAPRSKWLRELRSLSTAVVRR